MVTNKTHQKIDEQLDKKLEKKLAAVFSEQGLLSQHFDHYRQREAQQIMARAVAKSINGKQKLVIEAGTGIGKTFAYLIPAILSGKQIIISTGSKNLQEQLFYKDLPVLEKLLSVNLKAAILKGRSNYLCQLRLVDQIQNPQSKDSKVLDDLLKLHHWASMTKDGDFGSLNSISEGSQSISLVASRQDACTGEQCQFYQSCFTRLARNRAQQAKIIVVNHHLYFADRLLKEAIEFELLPQADVTIFDEAHLLPKIIIGYLGNHASFFQLSSLVSHIESVYRQQMMDSEQITQACLLLKTTLAAWEQLVSSNKTSDWRQLLANKVIATVSWDLLSAFNRLSSVLTANAGRNEQLDDSATIFDKQANIWRSFIECENNSLVYSLSYQYQSLYINMTPAYVTSQCDEIFDNDNAWIFTSATLQIDRSLQYFSKEIGLKKPKQYILESPFDYQNHSLLCVPRSLGLVNNVNDEQSAAIIVQQFVKVCIKAINAADGRTFILFTSHRMLEQVARELITKVTHPLLIQGQDGKRNLLKKFVQLGNAVLLGTASFWEGVDVKGKLLSCVIIDKLPFLPPEDPYLKVRSNQLLLQGKDPFIELSLTSAVLALKQGIGRLIRDENDKGVIILCDNRIVNRVYGQAFINSLPPMQRTRDLDKALTYLSDI